MAIKPLTEKQMKESVRIYVGKQFERMTRKEAIDKYLEGMMVCDGSEADRYKSIYCQLMAGHKTVSDKLDWW